MSRIHVLKLKNKLQRELQIIKTLDVLKQIAISEFQFLDKERKEAQHFTAAVETFLRFYRARKLTDSVFFNNPCKTGAVVIVGSDEGFLGALNNQIIEKAVEICRESVGSYILVVGKRSARKAVDAGLQVEEEYPGIPLPVNYNTILTLKDRLMQMYLDRQIGRARIIYAKCHSFVRQTVEVKELLPFDALSLGEFNRENPDAPVRFANQEPLEAGELVIEPDFKRIAEYTIMLWFGRKLYEIFWHSKLSEVAARSIDLNERFQSHSAMSAKTRLRFFRAAHEVIDSGIREVFASQHFAKKIKGIIE